MNPGTGVPVTQVDKVHVGSDGVIDTSTTHIRDNTTVDNVDNTTGNGNPTDNSGAIVGAINSLGGTVSQVGANIVSSVDAVQSAVNAASGNISSSVSSAASGINAQLSSTTSQITQQIATSSTAVKSSVDAAKGSIDSVRDSLIGVAKDATSISIDNDIKATRDSILSLPASLKPVLDAAVMPNIVAVNDVRDKIVALPGQMISPIVTPITQSIADVRDRVTALPDALITPIVNPITQSIATVKASTDAVKDAVDANTLAHNQPISVNVTGDGGSIAKPTYQRESIADALTGVKDAFVNSPLIQPFTIIGPALSGLGLGTSCNMPLSVNLDVPIPVHYSSNIVCELLEPQFDIFRLVADFIWVLSAAFIFLKA